MVLWVKQYNESNWMAAHFMPDIVEFIVLNNTIYTATNLHSERLKVMWSVCKMFMPRKY